MTGKREYHVDMKTGWVLAISLGMFATPCFVTSSQAQVNGAPTSVTSPGFGGRPVNGAPASVTSVGPQGYAPEFQPGRPGTFPSAQHPKDSQRGHNNRRDRNLAGPVYYAVPVPYATDPGPAPGDEAYAGDDADHQGGPTVFDRRGAGERSYIAPEREAAPAHEQRDEATSARSERSDAAPAPEPAPEPDPLDPTVLVFKDGHKLEVENYAIVGSSIFDLSQGHRHKIALADLDIPATRKANDERGVVFELPPSLKKN